LGVVRFVGGQCEWWMGVVVVGGWAGYSSWAVLVVRVSWWFFLGVRPFFVGARPLFEVGEVRGWAVCVVDGRCRRWRVGGGCWWVGGLFFVGGGCRSYRVVVRGC